MQAGSIRSDGFANLSRVQNRGSGRRSSLRKRTIAVAGRHPLLGLLDQRVHHSHSQVFTRYVTQMGCQLLRNLCTHPFFAATAIQFVLLEFRIGNVHGLKTVLGERERERKKRLHSRGHERARLASNLLRRMRGSSSG